MSFDCKCLRLVWFNSVSWESKMKNKVIPKIALVRKANDLFLNFIFENFKSHKSQITNHKSQVTSYKVQFTSYKSQVTSHKLQVMSHKLQVTSYKSQVSNYKSQVIVIKLKISFHFYVQFLYFYFTTHKITK